MNVYALVDALAAEEEIRAGDTAYEAEAALVFEAARMLKAKLAWNDEVWWCPIHRGAHEVDTDCWGAGLEGIDNCEPMWLRVRLIAAREVNR